VFLGQARQQREVKITDPQVAGGISWY